MYAFASDLNPSISQGQLQRPTIAGVEVLVIPVRGRTEGAPRLPINANHLVAVAIRERLLAGRGIHDNLGWLTRAYFTAYTAGQVLPTSIGGDAMRIFETTRRHPGRGA